MITVDDAFLDDIGSASNSYSVAQSDTAGTEVHVGESGCRGFSQCKPAIFYIRTEIAVVFVGFSHPLFSVFNCRFFSLQIGVQFIGNAVYTSVWVAAVCLFMELLGFSTQKWITAGGFGTVLITLAGREVILFEFSYCEL